MGIRLDTGYLKDFVSESELNELAPAVAKAHADLHQKTGAGHEFLGWVDLPSKTPDLLIKELSELAKEVAAHSQAIISIGIGGSYLGIRRVTLHPTGLPLRILKLAIAFFAFVTTGR